MKYALIHTLKIIDIIYINKYIHMYANYIIYIKI